jgi:hypothetical protein
MADYPSGKRKAEEQPLKEVLEKMLEVYKLKGKLNQSRIRTLWASLMGPAIVKHTTKIKIHRQRLYVDIDSAALRQELTYGRAKILKMLNQELGENYLEEVIIR